MAPRSTQVAFAGRGEPQPLGFQNMSPVLGESTIFTLLASQDGTKIGPRSPQVGLETVLTCDRFLHRFSDRFLVVFGLRFGALLGPPGRHLGGQNGTKTDPKTIKNRSENRRGKKSYPRRSWARLGAILGRLGCHLGPTWTSISCSRPRWRSFFGKITCSMLRRFEGGFGTNLGGPSRQKERK